MKKIALVFNIPAPYRVDLFRYFQTKICTYEFYIIYTNKSEDNRQWSVKENQILNTYYLESKIIKIKSKTDNRYIHLPRKITSLLSSINPDVVIAAEYNPAAIQCMLWCKVHQKKFINLTDGTLLSEQHIGRVQKLTRWIITHNIDACIASSSKAKEKLLAWGVNEAAIFISFLTVDVRNYNGLQRNVKPGRILFVGSIIKRKGLDLLIKALPHIKEIYELHIVGNGTEEEYNDLVKLAIENRVSDRIRWCGFKEGEALLDEYRQAALFVLPTREDCFGLVLLEASLAQVPIIVSKYADGAYDIVDQGINGYVVDPYDANEMANAINKVLSSNDIQNKRNETIKRKMIQFSFEEVSKGYLAAIDYALRN